MNSNQSYQTLVTKGISGRLKFLLNDSVAYGLAGALNKLLVLLIFPIVARYFSKEEFGVIDSLTYLTNIILPFLILGQDSAVARFFYDLKEGKERDRMISQAFWFVAFISILVTMLSLVFSSNLLEWYMNDISHRKYFNILLLTLPFRTLQLFSTNVLKWTLQRNRYLLITLGSSILNVSLTLGLIYFFNKGIEAIFIAQLITYVFSMLLGILFIHKHLLLIRSIDFLPQLLKLGLPYTFSGFIMMVLLSTDRYFLNNIGGGLAAVAIYGVAYKISSFMQLISNAFQTAWGPFAYSIYKEEDVNRTYNSALWMISAFMSFGALVLMLSSKWLVVILATEKYIDSIVIVIPLLFANLFECLGLTTIIGIDLSKKTIYYLVINLFCLFVAAVSMYILGHYYQAVGIALGFLITRFVYFLLATFFSYKLFQIRFNLSRPVAIVSLSAVVGFAYNFLESRSIWFEMLFASIALSIFCICSWVLLFSQVEKKLLKSYYIRLWVSFTRDKAKV